MASAFFRARSTTCSSTDNVTFMTTVYVHTSYVSTKATGDQNTYSDEVTKAIPWSEISVPPVCRS